MDNIQLTDRAKRIVLVIADLAIVPAVLYVAIILRYGEFKDVTAYWWLFPIAALSAVIAFHQLGLYRAIVRYIGPSSMLSVVYGISVSALLVTITAYLTSSVSFPRSAPVIFWFIGIISVGGFRLGIRGVFYGFFTNYLTREPIAIYGAGASGAQLAVALLNSNGTVPVAFFDDDRALRRKTIHGIRVYGPRHIERVIEQYKITQILLAIPSATSEQRKAIIDRLAALNVRVKTVPVLSELISGEAKPTDVREIRLEDLLGRDSIPPDPELVSIGVTGKVVMVTGGGGSIGSELVRILLNNRPRKLLVVDNSELNLFNIDRELSGLLEEHKIKTEVIIQLGCVTDRALMTHLMKSHGVSTVYHAAAYKHVHMVEKNPIEGIKNNIIGTRNLAEAAVAAAVQRFVLISSDKAVNPMNVMGATKRVSEMIVQSLAQQPSDVTFTMVRFGNVLGSSGSVVPLFNEQISKGGPVTVTHKDAMRYFMTITEAAELVIQAGGMAEGGEVYVLNMGEPVSIDQLARKMIRLSEHPEDIRVVYTGLRQGEKLSEELYEKDHVTGTVHPNILRTWEPVLPFSVLSDRLDKLAEACEQFDEAGLSGLIEEMCPAVKTFHHRQQRRDNVTQVSAISKDLV